MNTFLLTLKNSKIKDPKKYCRDKKKELDNFKNKVDGIAITRFYPDPVNKEYITCRVDGNRDKISEFFKKLEENNFKIKKKQKLVPI